MVLRTAGRFTLATDVSDLNDTVDHIRGPRSARLRRWETKIGLDVGRLDADRSSPEVLERVRRDVDSGPAPGHLHRTLRQMTDVNLGAVPRLTQAVQPRGAGASVQVAARPGVEPTARVAAYGVSKAALVHLTRLLGVELRENGGRVGAATPRPAERPGQPTAGDPVTGEAA